MLRRLVLLIAMLVVGALAGAPAACAVIDGFESPSHNIACAMESGRVRCDIGEKDWSGPPQPADCRLDYDYAVSVERHGRARFLCAGDTAAGIGHVLPYGATKVHGTFACPSRASGVRCFNRQNVTVSCSRDGSTGSSDASLWSGHRRR